MKKLLPLLTLLPAVAIAEQVPHTFTSGTAAKAADVNANFTHVNDKSTLNTTSITVIEAKLTELETAANSSPLDILVKGEVDLEVDCTDKPEALQLAYHENLNYRTLNFSLTGSCYGDIYEVRGDLEVDEGVQISGQTIGISSTDPENRASLIPNDESGKTFLIAGQGGGLYLRDLNITTGIDEYGAIMFSRNGHGDISTSTIYGAGTNAIPVVVQEGAQAYLSNIEINDAHIGIFARSNSTVRFLGETTVNSVDGIVLRTGVSVNHQGTVNVNSSGQGLYLNGGVDWIATGAHNLINLTGNVHLENGSFLNAGTLTLTGSINSFDSIIRSEGAASISGNTYLNNSTATFNDGTDASPSSFNCDGISSLEINGWQKVANGIVDDSTNCADKAAWNQALFNIFDNLNTPQ